MVAIIGLWKSTWENIRGEKIQQMPVIKGWKTAANLCTSIGILLAVIAVWQVWTGMLPILLPITLSCAYGTDPLDGWLARKVDKGRTQLGEMLDIYRDWVCQFVSLFALYSIASPGNEHGIVRSTALLEGFILLCVVSGTLKGASKESHGSGKARMIIFGALTFLVLAEKYWIGYRYGVLHISVWLMMITASACALAIIEPE